MSFVSTEEIKAGMGLNLAPMIDFLFLMLMFFACLAITRVTTKDTDVELVEAKPSTHSSMVLHDAEMKVININIDSAGQYKWVTDIRDYMLHTPEEIAQELQLQYKKGILP